MRGVCHDVIVGERTHVHVGKGSSVVNFVSEGSVYLQGQVELLVSESDVRTEYDFRYCLTGNVGVAGGSAGAVSYLKESHDGVEFLPINNTDKVMLHDLIGYELQKKQLVENTEAFVKGRPANNVLLYGDAGTGKSSSVKALINEYYKPDIALMCMGGDFAMGPSEAAFAVNRFFTHAKTVVPMHYGTQGCPGTPEEMKAELKRDDVNFLVVEPGKMYTL